MLPIKGTYVPLVGMGRHSVNVEPTSGWYVPLGHGWLRVELTGQMDPAGHCVGNIVEL